MNNQIIEDELLIGNDFDAENSIKYDNRFDIEQGIS